jgi:hypothetical protein
VLARTLFFKLKPIIFKKEELKRELRRVLDWEEEEKNRLSTITYNTQQGYNNAHPFYNLWRQL